MKKGKKRRIENYNPVNFETDMVDLVKYAIMLEWKDETMAVDSTSKKNRRP